MLKNINSKLEILFDQNFNSQVHTAHATREDEIQYDNMKNTNALENLSYIFTEEVTEKNIGNLFSQLSLHFELGMLLHKNSSEKYNLKEAFLYLKKITSLNTSVQIKLPQAELFKVLKTPAQTLLKRFHLSDIDTQNKMNCYLVAIAPNYSLALGSKIAEPWAAVKIEKLQNTLMKINFNL